MKSDRTFEEKAAQARRLAASMTDPLTIRRLTDLAEQLEAEAAAEAAGENPPGEPGQEPTRQ